MNITFIGTGYVGLVSGTMMSHLGHSVTCLDTDAAKISQLKRGILPIYEPGLERYLHNNMQLGRLNFTDKYDENLSKATAIFIAVNTPALQSGGADLSYIFEAIDQVSTWISKDCLVIIKSTVPPGTCQRVADYLRSKNLQNQVASNPEFLREGSAVEDFLKPHRLIFGTNSSNAAKLLEEIYELLIAENVSFVNTDPATAELIKYGSNAFLAIKIAFINEMANLCEVIGADIEQLSLGIGLDDRIGKKFLKAGPGFGGSCFPKDILALADVAKSNQSDFSILEAAIQANKRRPNDMVDKITNILDGTIRGKNIAMLGLTYKANTDDLRSSPAIDIINILKSKGCKVKAYDPAGMNNIGSSTLDIECTSNAVEACQQADAIVIATEWQEFIDLDFECIYDIMNSPIIIDLRNLLDPHLLKDKGFKYYQIGRLNKL